MNSLRSLIPVGLVSLALGGVAGCKKDEPPKPDPSAAASSSATGRANKLNIRNPMGPMAKVDPQTMKDYRVDICYYGTMSLRQARDAYFASLGKDEPSEKKIPSFGASSTPAPTPGASGSAKAGAAPPKPPTAPAPKASASALPAAGKAGDAGAATALPTMPERKQFDIFMRAPHERNARICTIAASLKEPPMGEVDTAVAAFAPFAVELAKDIATATSYYQKEEYKKDAFAKGKELHKKLVDEFAKLDDLSDKFGNALTGWRKDHPGDASKKEEGEKLGIAAMDDARAIVMAVVGKKADPETLKAGQEKLEKSLAALREYSTAHVQDQWSKIMAGPIEVFLKGVKEAKTTPDKSFDPEGYLTMVNNFTGLIESRQRGVSRASMAKNQLPTPTPTPAPSGGPAAEHP